MTFEAIIFYISFYYKLRRYNPLVKVIMIDV